jgi:hypothetical protein
MAPRRAQASAYARAVNLTAGDLPGFRVSPAGESEPERATEQQRESELLRCVHVVSSHALAEENSKEFERQSSVLAEGVKSEVTVAPSASLAAQELAVIRSAHARACVAHHLSLLLKGKDYGRGTFGWISIAQGIPPAPGTSGGFGWRITVKINVRGIPAPLYVDILGFMYGPAEVSLFTSGYPRPFSARSEERLFSLLLRRAKAHAI